MTLLAIEKADVRRGRTRVLHDVSQIGRAHV